MTNAKIIAELLDMNEADVEELVANGDPRVEMVDVVEVDAALDKAREDERKVIE